MIRCHVEDGQAVLFGPFDVTFLKVVNSIAGRKFWEGQNLKFQPLRSNITLLAESGYAIDFTGDTAALKTNLTTHKPVDDELLTKYSPAQPLFKYQLDALRKSWTRRNFALFIEMGLGKSAIIVANAGMLFMEKQITALLVVAPKGVNTQWLTRHVPANIDPSIPVNLIHWKNKAIDFSSLKGDRLHVFTINIDGTKTKLGNQMCKDFLTHFKDQTMMVMDESHLIKSPGTDRTVAVTKLGWLAKYRRICTGTPISRNVLDLFSQFRFLDEGILGHKYVTTFRARYCVMGGFEGRQVVAHKNIEELYALIDQHCFRITKGEVLDIAKSYDVREYEMGAKTRKHYDEIAKTFMTQLDNGEIVDVPSAAVALLRMQQVLSGYLPLPDGKLEVISSERIDFLKEIVEQIDGKVVIWARFRGDIERIAEALRTMGRKPVKYYGETKDNERIIALEQFIKGDATDFVSNPGAGGTGIDGLQDVSPTVIYFSNSFDAIHRWQSEDRTNRIGSVGTTPYIDIAAQRSLDALLTKNLRKKKSLSDLTLDEIRKAIAEAV